MPLYIGQVTHGEQRDERADDDTPWWKSAYGRWRLTAEAAAMTRFPAFQACESPEGRIGWTGWLHSALNPANRYRVRVTYPTSFPDEPPDIVIEEPALPADTPHLLFGGRPCLYNPVHGPRHGYDPARTTAATLIAWTALWIHAFETWQSTGQWPGLED